MLTNKKLLVSGIGLALVAVAAVIAVVVATSGEGPGDGRESVSADDQSKVAGDGSGLAMCAEDVPDCNDMIANPDGDVGDGLDEPVSAPPVTSGDDIDPDECSLVHNIDACEKQATDAALGEMAGRLGIDPAELKASAQVTAEYVEWPDSCLGISTPDVVCAEVITPGFKIVIDAGVLAFEYHTDMGSRLEFVDGEAG